MKCSYLRASTWNTFANCQWQYFLNYVCDIPSQTTDKTLLGSIVHHVFELLARCKKTGHYKLKDKYSDYNYLLKIVYKRYENQLKEDCFAKCKKSVEKVLNTEFNPLKLNILKVENQFEIDINRKGFKNKKLRGTVDLITEESPNTLHVIDFKTGAYKSDWSSLKDKVTEEDFKQDMQLQMYDLVSSILFPQYKYIMLTLIYVNIDGATTIHFEKHERAAFIETLRKRFLEIEQCENPSRIWDDPTRKNHKFKCLYVCQFGKYEVKYECDGHKITKLFGYKELNKLPKEIEHDGKLYSITNDPVYSLCNKYYSIFKRTKDLDQTKEKIVALTVSANKDTSRRNDYSHGKLHRGILT